MLQLELDLKAIRKAAERLTGIIRKTPLIAAQLDPEIFFKAESLQRTGSFKLRTAYHQMALLSADLRKRGVVTSSSGNFAQATAYSGRILGISTKIVMMRSSNPVKVEATKKLGGEVVFCDDRFDARTEAVRRIQAAERRTSIHPFDTPAAILANGTIALEILEQLPDTRHVVAPISGGGLISGIAVALHFLQPRIQVWGVQPARSNATARSFHLGRPVAVEKADTMADGLTVTRPGSITFPLIQKHVHEVIEVSEESILKATSLFFQQEKLVVEPSGAVPLAALLEGKLPRLKTVLVVSGGNIAPDVAWRALTRSG